jgi:hypothetical protein
MKPWKLKLPLIAPDISQNALIADSQLGAETVLGIHVGDDTEVKACSLRVRPTDIISLSQRDVPGNLVAREQRIEPCGDAT